MIQDMLTNGRFRWSLAPTSVHESEDAFLVEWDTIPPSECGACDGLQGARLILSKFCHYDFKLPECEDVEQEASCHKLLFQFYSRKGRQFLLVEESVVDLRVITLVTPLKLCGGGGTTPLVTAETQLAFWRSTTENYTSYTSEPFTLGCKTKIIPGTGFKLCPPGFENVLCECIPTGGIPLPDLPPLPQFPDFPLIDYLPIRTRTPILIGEAGFNIRPDGGSSEYRRITSSVNAFDPLVGISDWYVDPREVFFRSGIDRIGSCEGEGDRISQYVDLRRNDDGTVYSSGSGHAFAYNNVAGYFDTAGDGNFKCGRQIGVQQVFLRFQFEPGTAADPDGVFIDVPILTFRPAEYLDPELLDPPETPKCYLWRRSTFLALWAAGEVGVDFDAMSIFLTKMKDETQCAIENPFVPTPMQDLLNTFGTTYRLIGIDSVITREGECPCP